MSGKINFRTYASNVMSPASFAQMLPVVEKELLHYEILNALDRSGYLERIVFQGGTCLRLCYGSVRYSEDLDFTTGEKFSRADISDMKDTIAYSISNRYDVDVEITIDDAPESDVNKRTIPIAKWQITVATDSSRKDLPRQRIKLEIARVPSYTKVVRAMNVNYQGLPPSYGDILISCETLAEIVADKLVSFALSSYIRWRDIWDLRWIARRPLFTLNDREIKDLYRNKMRDYKATSDPSSTAEEMAKKLPTLVDDKRFIDQMRRFLPSDVIADTIDKGIFRQHIADEVSRLYRMVSENGHEDSCATRLDSQ
jgi:predicted nucleotidyltransferase component of viral defense system